MLLTAILLLLSSVMSPDIPAGVYFLAFPFTLEIAGQGHAGHCWCSDCLLSPFLWALANVLSELSDC
jgi:hypothetical protein